MKNFITFICLSALIGALGVSCDKHGQTGDGYRVDGTTQSYYPVFINKTSGEETIILTQKGLTYEEVKALRREFESEYGEYNIICNGSSFWPEEIKHDAPNCYEFTMIFEFFEFPVPTMEEIRNTMYVSGVVRIDDNTVIYKHYFWAFSEVEVEKIVSRLETYRYWNLRFGPFEFYNYDNTPTLGKQTGTIIVKNLGSEILYNEPIIF